MESRHLFNSQSSHQTHQLIHEPPDIYLDDIILDIKFSPNYNVLASAQVTGEVRVYQYSEEKNK